MDSVFLFVTSIVILTCVYFIVAPLYRTKGDLARFGINEEGPTLEAVYSAVNELEMDLLMKKISEEDFQQLKEQYQHLAVEIMDEERNTNIRQQKTMENKEIELELLQELQKLRTEKGRV